MKGKLTAKFLVALLSVAMSVTAIGSVAAGCVGNAGGGNAGGGGNNNGGIEDTGGGNGGGTGGGNGGNIEIKNDVATSTEIVNKTPESEARIIYIGTPANGTGSGTQADPYTVDAFNAYILSTTSTADLKLQPGNIVKVLPGVHKAIATFTVLESGSHDDYIIFEAADPTKETVIDFSGQAFASTARGVQIYGNYVYWRNIDVCGAGDNGLYIGGSYNIVENCEFYNNRDTGLQLGRSYSEYTSIDQWPSYNLIKNCTSYNNYDNETYGENADGFAAKLTVGYGNIFDGCIAYRNSDDGWDLYGKVESGNIGAVILYNCVAFENGYVMRTLGECNEWFGDSYNRMYDEENTEVFVARDGDGNGFKLGGSVMEGDVLMYNCLSFNNRMHGVTDNSNPGVLSIDSVTSYNNGAVLDTRSHLDIVDVNGNTNALYYAIGSNGNIYGSNGKQIVVDPDGNTQASFYKISGDGYIQDDKSNYLDVNGAITTDESARVVGSYIKAGDASLQTPNPDFGSVITTGTNDDDYGNINIERDDASYNNFTNVLSIINNAGLATDEYKGAGEYCILAETHTKAYKIEDCYDADSKNGKAGVAITAPLAEDVFVALPANNLGLSDDIHETYRNADNSINMGDILKIKDYTLLFGNDHKIGSDLTGTCWEDYKHFNYTYLTDETVTDPDDAVLTAMRELVYVPCKLNSCYQDIDLVVSMKQCSITWTSSDPSVIDIGSEVYSSISQNAYVHAVVNRQAQDTLVTLTAVLTYNGQAQSKTFEINVKAADPELGDVEAVGVVNGSIIFNQYDTSASEPEIVVYDASDYNGKTLSEDKYTVETVYKYAENKNAAFITTRTLNFAKAGVYEITKNITLNKDDSSTSYSYLIYVVAPDGEIDFVEAPVVSVNKVGYVISGNLSNVSGTLYTMISDTEPSVEQLKANGTAFTITTDSVLNQYEADNSAGYSIYYVICNPVGRATSQVYRTDIATVEISTKDEFQSLAQSGGKANEIYLLTADLDFTGYNWIPGTQGLVGLLNGMNHTISGIQASGSADGTVSIFSSLKGGTIMNIAFENIKLTNEGYNKVGIIAQAYSGYLYNIQMKNIYATGAQRVGALIGQALEDAMPLYIDRVSLINDREDAIIFGSSLRAGGIIGLIQPTSAPVTDLEIHITNCYVNATIGTSTQGQSGGIVGTYDTSKAGMNFYLEITNCYFAGTAIANSRCGGILGYQQGNGTLRITNCVNYGYIYHAGSTSPINTPEKNASGIMGGYVITADAILKNCYSRISEYNADYDVETIFSLIVSRPAFWTDTVKFDMDVWELVYKEGSTTTLAEPYMVLK